MPGRKMVIEAPQSLFYFSACHFSAVGFFPAFTNAPWHQAAQSQDQSRMEKLL
jgi:hypothetical protein